MVTDSVGKFFRNTLERKAAKRQQDEHTQDNKKKKNTAGNNGELEESTDTSDNE